MSWNLIIYKQGNSLGRPDHVKAVFSSVFSELEWESPTEAALPVEGGLRLADAQEGEDVDLDDPVRWMEERCG
jgi:hypothetical protein